MRYKIPMDEIKPLWDAIPGDQDIGSIYTDGDVIVYDHEITKFNNNPMQELVNVSGDTEIVERTLDDYSQIAYAKDFRDQFADKVQHKFEIYNYLAEEPSEDRRYKHPYDVDSKTGLAVKPTKLPVIFDIKGTPKSKEYVINGKPIMRREFEFTFFTKETMLATPSFLPVLQYIADQKGLPQVQPVYEGIAEQLGDHLIWTKLEKFRYAYENGEYSDKFKPAPMDYVTFEGTIDLVSYYNFRKHERIIGRDNIVTNLEPVVVMALINSGTFPSAGEAQLAGGEFLDKYGLNLNAYVQSGNTALYELLKNDTEFDWLDLDLPQYTNVTIRKYIVNRLKQVPEDQLSNAL